jgi:hypothetical protein
MLQAPRSFLDGRATLADGLDVIIVITQPLVKLYEGCMVVLKVS